MDLDYFITVKEEDHMVTVVKDEPRDECESVAANMTECDTSECEVTEQFLESIASSTEQGIDHDGLLVMKREETDITEECALESEELDEMAFVAVKIEPAEEYFNDQTDVTIKNKITMDSAAQDNITDSASSVTSPTFCTSVDNDGKPPTFIANGHVNKRRKLSTNLKQMQFYKKTVTASPNTCSECGYVAASPSHLKIHTSVHTSDQPHHCEECPYKCSDTESLEKHMLIHSIEKPFQCKQCSHRCNTASNLKIHTMMHTGEKPFKCDECSFECRQAGNLKRHMMIHTGEQPYECKECSYKCSQEGTLKRHVLSHRGEQPFHCMECSYKTSRLFYLKKHISETHGE